MKSVRTFLFGSGWSTLWHVFHYLLLLPVWAFYTYCRDFKPGAGPQGGETIFLFMVLFGLVVFGVGAINALVLISCRRLVWWQRFILWPLVLLLFPVVAIFLGFAMFDAATDSDFTSTGRLRVAVALPTLTLIYYGMNFAALARTRSPAHLP